MLNVENVKEVMTPKEIVDAYIGKLKKLELDIEVSRLSLSTINEINERYIFEPVKEMSASKFLCSEIKKIAEIDVKENNFNIMGLGNPLDEILTSALQFCFENGMKNIVDVEYGDTNKFLVVAREYIKDKLEIILTVIDDRNLPLTIQELIDQLQTIPNKNGYVFACNTNSGERFPITLMDDNFESEENSLIDIDLNFTSDEGDE